MKTVHNQVLQIIWSIFVFSTNYDHKKETEKILKYDYYYNFLYYFCKYEVSKCES